VLLLILLGTIDLARCFMVLDLLTHAAATGCRTGVLPGNGNSAIDSAVSTALTSAGINGALAPLIEVQPQGQTAWTSPGDAGAAQPGDAVRVTASVSYRQVSWLPFKWVVSPNATLSSSVVMCKE
jgi:hypothetical protein